MAVQQPFTELLNPLRLPGLRSPAPRVGKDKTFLDKIATQLGEHAGPLRISVRGVTYNYTADADVLKDVASRPEDFPKNVPGSGHDPRGALLKRTLGEGLATASDSDEIWQIARRILGRALGATALKRYFPKMVTVVDDLLEPPGPGPWTVEVLHMMERIAFEVMAYTSLGTRFYHSEATEPVPFADALRYVMADTWQARMRRFPAFFYPVARRRRERADEILASTVDRLVLERRSSTLGARPSEEDILQAMLDSPDKITGKTLPDENIRHQIVTLLGASLETTASALSYALYELTTQPEVEARMVGEIDRVLGKDAERRPTMEALHELDFTDRVVKEVLRLHPPGAIVLRHVARDTRLAGEHRVHRDEKLAIFLPALHRDPRYWHEPDRFDPERFLPEAVSARHPHAYHPFGIGIRHCIGFQLATLETKLVLARLLQRFQPRLADPSYTLREVFTDTAKPVNLTLRLEPRESD